MKKHTLTLALTLAAGVSAMAQKPDTTVTIKTTNNQLYQLSGLLNIASQQLLKSEMPVKDYVEFQKEYQALLNEWFEQKKAQTVTIKAAKQ